MAPELLINAHSVRFTDLYSVRSHGHCHRCSHVGCSRSFKAQIHWSSRRRGILPLNIPFQSAAQSLTVSSHSRSCEAWTDSGVLQDYVLSALLFFRRNVRQTFDSSRHCLGTINIHRCDSKSSIFEFTSTITMSKYFNHHLSSCCNRLLLFSVLVWHNKLRV